jgi:hypothetical protein
MDPSIPNANTSRNLDADGKPLYPSIYEFKEFIMINKTGNEKDITHLVTSFVIAEEIYSPVLTGKIRIRDNENFFEDFGLDGQEIVKVKIEYLDSIEENNFKSLTYQFVVKDYPLFEKTTESINVQEYDINLISPWAYLSRLQQMSRSVEGNPVYAIKEIFNTYLAYPKFDYSEGDPNSTVGSEPRNPCETNNLKAVITQRTPLQAVEYLKSLCYDKDRSPFFIYTTLENQAIIARSWVDIISESSNPLYKPAEFEDSYAIRPFSAEKAGTPESLKELRSKIISLSSNIKLDKLSQAVNGGYGSVTEVIDLKERSYTEDRALPETKSIYEPRLDSRALQSGRANRRGDFSQGDFDFSYLENLDFINETPKILDNITDDPRVSQSVYYLPIQPYPQEFVSPADIKLDALPYVKKYFANMEAAVHEIGVYGDPKLSAATKIKIKIPKAVDTNQDEAGIDESLSGVYIIAVSIHTFENGVYTNRLKIIKERNIMPELPDDGSITGFFSDTFARA